MRGPHRYGVGRAIDGDAGGVADLQTDVMRFMAILALCLVVIFALVQSIPRPVTAAPETSAPSVEPERVAAPSPVALTQPASQPETAPPPVAGRVVLTRPAPRRLAPDPVVAVTRPTPKPRPERIDETPEPTTESTPSTPEPAKRGFTLQFESDTALMRLVARNEVGLYAHGDDRALRMSVSRDRVSFWPASTPNAFHEMDPSTVPADVAGALRRGRNLAADVTWGVTLSANVQRELDAIVSANAGGALFIAGDGRIRLEP